MKVDEWQRLERWIAQLVETPFARLFAGRITPQELAARLIKALEQGEQHHADGTVEVAGSYRIQLNARDLQSLRASYPDLEDRLAAALEEAVRRMGLRLRTPPHIVLEGETLWPRATIRIVPITPTPQDPTREIVPAAGSSHVNLAETATAVLIIGDGHRTFELRAPLVRIGRAIDNDLILDDETVSRHHATLRRHHRHYLLIDQRSRSGTRINGYPVQEAVLRSGDRIEIGRVTLLYLESAL